MHYSLLPLIFLLSLFSLNLAAPVPAAVPKTLASALTSRASGGSGEATFYEPGLGACGRVNGPNDMIAAVAIGRGKGECGNRIRVSCGGKQIEVEIVDLCASCAPNDVDLSPIAFNQLADPDQGRVAITWEYV